MASLCCRKSQKDIFGTHNGPDPSWAGHKDIVTGPTCRVSAKKNVLQRQRVVLEDRSAEKGLILDESIVPERHRAVVLDGASIRGAVLKEHASRDGHGTGRDGAAG